MNKNDLNDGLHFLFHTEFLSTLAGIKPLAILRAFPEPRMAAAWESAWQSGILHNPDLIWKMHLHKSGPVLRVASVRTLQKLNFDFAEPLDATFFDRLDEYAGKLVSEADSHRFWGKILGYPLSQVERYAVRTKEDPGMNLPLYPQGFAHEYYAEFVVFESMHPEVVSFVEKNHRAVSTFAQRVQAGESLAAIFNYWPPTS